MPVRYSEHSAGPSTRASAQYVEDAVPAISYSSLTKAQLQEALETRGLPTSGNKADLIARLEEDDG